MRSTKQSPLELSRLVEQLRELDATLTGRADVTVGDVCQDSRQVTPGALFAARRGERADGVRFIPDAISRGAAAVLAARGSVATPPPLEVPLVEVSDMPRALALAAEAVHGQPSRALRVIAITGTNGKTTCASLLAQCLRGLGHRTGQLGTLGLEISGGRSERAPIREPGGLTTPEADVLSRTLARARDGDAEYFVMEASSHAIAQHRIDALRFAVAGFTNLTQDHLDFHPSMEEYAETKARLFSELAPTHSVINIDDAFGCELAARLSAASASVVRVGRGAEADVRLLREDQQGRLLRLQLAIRGGHPVAELSFETQVLGAHNTDNWLLTVGLLLALRVPLQGLSTIAPDVVAAPGRLERCDSEADDIGVFVDYAHTPDALRRALQACRCLTTGVLWCVFGCGGDRDSGKRPLMGIAARELADRIVVTSDNPRTEDPLQILADIEAGLGAVDHVVEVERSLAIRHAVSKANAGDLVLIAGKGHEDYQILGGRRVHFDDREQARAALKARRSARESC